MSLYRRGGVWWYDFIVNGIRVRESTGLASRAAAAKAETLRKAELLQRPAGQELRGPAPRFDEFALMEFAAWSENQHREHPSTHPRYMRSVRVLIRFLGHRPLDMISSADVEHFKIARSRERRKNARDGRTVTPAAVNRDLAVLRILFNLAVRLKRAKMNPVSGVKLLPEHNLQMRVLSWDEESAYLAAASQPLRDVATLILQTGMRPGEVFHLKKEDVSLQLGFIHIPSGKTDFARRTIPLTARAREALGRRLLEMKSEWLFPAATDSSRPVASVADAHEAAIRRSKIERPFRLYDLRHTALTRMAMAGVDLPTLRELAGHASIQMTMRYVHPTTEHKKLALLRFEESTRKANLSNNPITWPIEAQVGQPSSNHPPRR
jgi:integrase